MPSISTPATLHITEVTYGLEWKRLAKIEEKTSKYLPLTQLLLGYGHKPDLNVIALGTRIPITKSEWKEAFKDLGIPPDRWKPLHNLLWTQTITALHTLATTWRQLGM